MADSAFWGASIAANEEHPLALPDGIVLTIHNIAINGPEGTKLQLVVEMEDDDDDEPVQPLVIATLTAGRVDQYASNVNFFPGDQVKLLCKGDKGVKGSLDIIGTLDAIDNDEDDWPEDDDDMLDEEEEEEEEQKIPVKKVRQEQEKPKTAPEPAKKEGEGKKKKKKGGKKGNKQ
eukprot:TRINITY_DN2363_c1_g1_i1.p1 TRINITY_DN2363_c1_g1~~TRINITY_DN2363_c1_g1_i1.p1  ORF type:complete len:194 (-),score=57.80 TRINITY_DN2363_c1_g1_i1:131-655(-)